MPLPQHMTTVTPLSAALAVFLFAFIPMVTFFIGSYVSPYNHEGLLENKLEPPLPTKTAVVPQSEGYVAIPGWKTYTNEQYKFAIDYPGDWAFREFPDTKDGAGFRLAKDPNDLCCELITIQLQPRMYQAQDVPFENYVAMAGQGIQGFETLKSSQKIQSMSGVTGYTTIWNITNMDGKSGESSPMTYFPAPQKEEGIISVSIVDPRDTKNIDVYNKMLTTFRFVE